MAGEGTGPHAFHSFLVRTHQVFCLLFSRREIKTEKRSALPGQPLLSFRIIFIPLYDNLLGRNLSDIVIDSIYARGTVTD